MTKPRLVKVRALFCVLQQVTKKRLRHFDTASFWKGGLAEEEFGGLGPRGGGDGEDVETGGEGSEVGGRGWDGGCRRPEGEDVAAAEVMEGGERSVGCECEGAADEIIGRCGIGNADLGQCRSVVIVGAGRGCHEAVAADAGTGGIEDEFGNDRRFSGRIIVGIIPGIVAGIITRIVLGITPGIVSGVVSGIIARIAPLIVAGNIIVVIA